jgi:hypothetical protein
MTINSQNNNTAWNAGTIAPGANTYPERVTNVVEVELADNVRREGPRYFEEQLVQRGRLGGHFAGGAAHDGEGVYDLKIAEGRSPIAGDLRGPSQSRGITWDVLDQPTLTGFAQGVASAPGQATPFPWQPREGRNTSTITPLFGLNEGERPTAVFERAVAPPQGGRARRSPADISDR